MCVAFVFLPAPAWSLRTHSLLPFHWPVSEEEEEEEGKREACPWTVSTESRKQSPNFISAACIYQSVINYGSLSLNFVLSKSMFLLDRLTDCMKWRFNAVTISKSRTFFKKCIRIYMKKRLFSISCKDQPWIFTFQTVTHHFSCQVIGKLFISNIIIIIIYYVSLCARVHLCCPQIILILLRYKVQYSNFRFL